MSYRSASDSRCCSPGEVPYIWRTFYDLQHPSVRELEEWLNSLSPFNRMHELGRIDDLFDKAANGQLWDSNDSKTPIKPINSDPELFELRHTALKKPLRFYHAEPPRYPRYLIGLHKHIKSSPDSQQSEIEFAIRSYRAQGI